ncbi:MAG: phenylalanine--tRNA ligase subunit alpha [Bacilli bacterium]|nr:phenylalanine--tRNA ligase subunit alpha [Bacilli bacterium]
MAEMAKALKDKALAALNGVADAFSLDGFFSSYLAKKGEINALMSKMREIPNEEKAEFGAAVNEARNEVSKAFEEKKRALEEAALAEKLKHEAIDITLPGVSYTQGRTNPFHAIIDEVTDIFLSMGFEVCEGREIETDRFNFELLNVPQDHPSRDMQDTFYFPDGRLLRTQTSGEQAHRMIEGGKGPIRMISPGKVYRHDDDDATHSHQFGQIEGLVVDKNISIANLKATLELFAKKMFGEKREIRMRSSYFPFTEPSVEVDVSCFKCGGSGCSTCKGTGWIEILGAGMVNPHVLEMCGYDPEVYSGFAFGIGIERVAMLRYGIDDIRRFYQNDVRFLKDF